jgi:phospholipid:diacylglycerol acyltransferase
MLRRPNGTADNAGEAKQRAQPTAPSEESIRHDGLSTSTSASVSATGNKNPKKQKKRSLWLTFAIGGILGLLLAGMAKKHDMVSLELMRDLKLDSLIVIPAGILKEASDISRREKDAVSYEAFSTGLALKAEGLNVKHPVVMVSNLRV